MRSLQRCGLQLAILISLSLSSADTTTRELSFVKAEAAREQSWIVSSTPVVSIPNELSNGEFLLRVRKSLRRRDGSIVIASAGTHRIYFFSSAGTLVRAIGTKGEGPGEFGNLTTIAAAEDGVLTAYDGQRRAISRFSATGDFLGTSTLSSSGIKLPTIKSPYIAYTGPGVFLVSTSERPTLTRGAVFRQMSTFYRVSENEPSLLARLPTTEQYSARNGSTLLVPFGKQLLFAQSATRTYLGDSGSDSIIVWNAKGQLNGVIHLGMPKHIFSRAERKRITDSLVAARNSSRDVQELAAINEVPLPAAVPVFRSLLVDETGLLWVQAYDWPKARNQWTIVDDGGIVRGRVTLPAKFVPMDVGANYVLGVAVDADGFERVELYALKR